jgi:cytochrome c oxidase cbb3-type subunit III
LKKAWSDRRTQTRMPVPHAASMDYVARVTGIRAGARLFQQALRRRTPGKQMWSLSLIGIIILALASCPLSAQQSAGAGRGFAPGQSPASRRPPAGKATQSYTSAEIQAGQTRFGSQCGFCHGRDAQGGESGPDLARSALVAEDDRGDKIGPVIRSGRPDKGMPAFSLPAADIASIVAFIHDAKSQAESAAGGRRSVDPSDFGTGNAEAGKRYFMGAGGCMKCHSLSGSFATIGSRYQGLALLQRMLYPRGGRGAPSAPRPAVTITTADGEKISGKLAYRDEFSLTLVDAEGWSRSWPAASVKITSEDPLRAHQEQLGEYTEEEMHDVLAFLRTLE